MVHLLVDNRERNPVKAINIYAKRQGVTIEWTRLQTGDYACSDACCGFERKEDDLDDMHGTMIQTTELRSFYQNAYFIVNVDPNKWVVEKGSRAYAPRMAFWGSMVGPRYLPPIYVSDYTMMLDLMFQIIKKNHDTKKRGKGEFNHVRHVKKKDISVNILTSIPAIGPKMAERILDAFGSVANFVMADEKQWKEVEGIGIKTCVQISDALFREV